MKLSTALQDIATLLDDELRRVAGEPLAFVLLVSADNVAQYVSNASRADGTDLIKSLLQRWEAGRADIPAHYNPDLKTRVADAGWLPIETAPKETEVFIGRFIDGVWKYGRSAQVWEQANEFAGETFSGWVWTVDDCYDSVAECPTHWRPAFNAPSKGGV